MGQENDLLGKLVEHDVGDEHGEKNLARFLRRGDVAIAHSRNRHYCPIEGCKVLELLISGEVFKDHEEPCREVDVDEKTRGDLVHFGCDLTLRRVNTHRNQLCRFFKPQKPADGQEDQTGLAQR